MSDTVEPWVPGAALSLHTARFVLRSMAREDVDERFIGWLADPALTVGLNLPLQRLSRAQAVRYVLSHDNRARFFIGVFVRDGVEPNAPGGAGQIGFFTLSADPTHRVAETAVVIGERSWWGRDVVVEARSALLTFAFTQLGQHKVLGRPHGRNFASIYNYKAMGFRCEAVLREQMQAVDGDGRLDQLVFGLLRSEWLARQNHANPGEH
jgi:[ribosomal protein S5]-alanine N-acetyltransferase